MTLRDLLEFHADPWHTSAQVWHRLAQGIDDTAEQVIRSTRDVGDAWPGGAGSAAAVRRATTLRAEVSNAYNPAKRIAEAMEHHAYAMSGLRRQAEEIVASARQAGYHVDLATGVTTAPPSADMAGGLDRSSRSTESVLQYLPTVVDHARAQDDATANRISVNVPSPGAGFGTGQLDGVSRAVLEAQSERSPAEIHAWWESLTPLQQEQVLREFPELVGRMDGIPVSDRDVANRSVLERERSLFQQQLSTIEAREDFLWIILQQGRFSEVYPDAEDPRTALENELRKLASERVELPGKLRGIDAITARLNDVSLPEAYLIGYSSDGDGRAIVSVGDPDTADNVLTYVPGTGEHLSKVGAGLERADIMARDALKAAPDENTSVVYWYGYDAPNTIFPDAGLDSYAEGGGPLLDTFQTGLRATHDGGIPSHNTVLGHSYGSTVIGHAAKESTFNADALVFVGSPGVDVNHASELNGVRPGQVWVTTAENDIIRRVPDWDFIHGNDPSDRDFGARVFASDPGNPDDEAGTHSAYWDQDNIARKNIARIVTDSPVRLPE